MKLHTLLQSGNIIVLDGAMGTELIRRGVDLPSPLWSAEANLTHPQIVKTIHQEYASAGADILTANTFRTTPRSFRKAGYSSKAAKIRARNSLMKAVEIARTIAESNCLVAGSIAPLEDCYTPKLFPGSDQAIEEYYELGEWFAAAGVDILLIETMGHPEEIQSALTATRNTGAPKWVSFILKDNNRILGGQSLQQILVTVEQSGVEVVLLNCNSIKKTRAGISTLTENWHGYWGVYPNLGIDDAAPGGKIKATIPVNRFKDEVITYLRSGAKVIGACCGSTPDHIRAIRKSIDSSLC